MTRSGGIPQIGGLAVLLLLLAGCSQVVYTPAQQPTLLFDRLPCGIDADQFAARSERTWVIPRSLDGPESFYREYSYDAQGSHYHHFDHYSRRVRTVRWGRGSR